MTPEQLAAIRAQKWCEHIYCPNGCTVRAGMCESCVAALLAEVERLSEALADAERRNLMSYCAWCGEEFPHPTRDARQREMPAHALDCPLVRDAYATLERATVAEDPDEWVADGLALVERMEPVVTEIKKRAPNPPGDGGA